MSKLIADILNIKIGIGDRIRQARTRVGLKQSELAEFGGIARTTQLAYEAGSTEPTTAYLRNIQQSPVDVPYLLFGVTSQEIQAGFAQAGGIDWALVQRCHEDVEFFCSRFASDCPQNYRWQMVQQAYQTLSISKGNATPEQPTPNGLALVQGIWKSYDTEFQQI